MLCCFFHVAIVCPKQLQNNIKNFLSLSLLPFLFARDRAVPARMAFFHDHGGQFCGVGWSAVDACGGLPLSRLAGSPSCHHLSPSADAVLHLVRQGPEHLLHSDTHASLAFVPLLHFKVVSHLKFNMLLLYRINMWHHLHQNSACVRFLVSSVDEV